MRLPGLIDAFVTADGRDRSTIEHVARVIRENGMIPTTKRGSGAAEMTSAAAVNLLFALNGASSAQGALEAVNRLRKFTQSDVRTDARGPFKSLGKIHAFGEALEHLIEHYPTFSELEIEIEIQRLTAQITFRTASTSACIFAATYDVVSDKTTAYLHQTYVDRRVIVRFSEFTLDLLHYCISTSRS